jgi:choline dehydrogenase-like flavoprotein
MKVDFDYIIARASSAGCVLASRLTEDPGVTVALVLVAISSCRFRKE